MKDMFKEKDGKISMARVGAFVVLLLGVAWNVASMIKWAPMPEGTVSGITSLVSVFMVWAGVTKVADKKEEVKNDEGEE